MVVRAEIAYPGLAVSPGWQIIGEFFWVDEFNGLGNGGVCNANNETVWAVFNWIYDRKLFS